MKREDARNCRLACQYILDNISEYNGKNINKLGEKSISRIQQVWERAKEIYPDISGIGGTGIFDRDGKTIDLHRYGGVNDKLSRAVSWIEKWDKVDASITVGEYIETKKKYIALLDQYKETLKGEGLSMNDLSIMGLI